MRNGNHIEICREENCQCAATTEEFCRYHYLKNWQKIRKVKSKELEVLLTRHIKKLATQNEDDIFSPHSLDEILRASDIEELLEQARKEHNKDEDDIDIDKIIRNIKIDK